ncbi:hypothetical protein GCM10022254_28670 [Actinomadura meridiana]|uniref:Lipoprotein n=1 Tax=Actinomadura meridiana TaxID=559626 RepID=A0ABP8C0B3_9ACTN
MRIAIAVTGAVLLLCGCAALAAGFGAAETFGVLSSGPVLVPALGRFADENGWFLPTAAAVAETVALSGQLWLVLQCRSLVHRRWPDLDARTRDLARSAADDLNRDARELTGVQDLRARLTGTAARPRLRLRITCADDVPLGDLYKELGEGPVERYRRTIGMVDLPVVIRFRPASTRPGKRGCPQPDTA